MPSTFIEKRVKIALEKIVEKLEVKHPTVEDNEKGSV